MLSILDGLTVRSRTSSFAFRDARLDAREAGKRLEADYILERSVLRAARRLRVNVQFIRVRDDTPVWSHEFERDVTDVFAIQE
jgi:adenylate cyclase